MNTLKMLQEEKVNISQNDIIEILGHASRNGDIEVIKSYIDLAEDIHIYQDSYLRHAAQNGYLDICEFLVEKGLDLHADREYALIQACCNGHLGVVKFLIQNGANYKLLDKSTQEKLLNIIRLIKIKRMKDFL